MICSCSSAYLTEATTPPPPPQLDRQRGGNFNISDIPQQYQLYSTRLMSLSQGKK